MPIQEHPIRGTILMCDFDKGFIAPEMVKNRPVIVISPKIHRRPNLCTVVALSTTAPEPIENYHAQIDLNPHLPPHMQSNGLWIKGDMVYSVGFHRLNLIRTGKINGVRQYYYSPINSDQLKIVQRCVLNGLGLSSLTTHI